MKTKITPVICAACLLLAGCSSTDSVYEPTRTEPANSAAKVSQTEAVSENAQQDSSEAASDPVKEEKSSEIPADAVTLKTVVTLSNGETAETAREYLNAQGDPLLILVSYSPDGGSMPLTNAEYKYDKLGRMIWKHENTITNDYVNYTYDAEGRLVTEDYYKTDFHPHRIEYSYDKYGNLLRKVTTYTEEEGIFYMMSSTEDFSDMELDNAGRIVKLREMNFTGTAANYETLFTYDGFGNCIRTEKTALAESVEPASEITNRIYDIDGNVTAEITERVMRNGKKQTVRTTRQYDSEGRLTNEYQDADGDITETQYSYAPV